MLKPRMNAIDNDEHFYPLSDLEKAIHYWWVVGILMIVGGVAGMFAYVFRPEIFEAKAQFSIAIDYVSTGPLTQYDEDLAINTAGNIYMSAQVLQRVVDQAKKEGIVISLDTLRKQITIERHFSVWNLLVRDTSAQEAEQLANIWLEQGETILQQSYLHATQAYILERYIEAQENCLENLGTNDPVGSRCNNVSFNAIQNNLREVGITLYRERQAANGIFFGLTLGPFNPVNGNTYLVTSGRSQYVLFGSLLGLLISIFMIEFLLPKTRLQKIKQ